MEACSVSGLSRILDKVMAAATVAITQAYAGADGIAGALSMAAA